MNLGDDLKKSYLVKAFLVMFFSNLSELRFQERAGWGRNSEIY